jgi:hypothetical protein
VPFGLCRFSSLSKIGAKPNEDDSPFARLPHHDRRVRRHPAFRMVSQSQKEKAIYSAANANSAGSAIH